MSRRGQRGRVRPREDGWDGWGGYMNAKRQKLKEQFDKEAPQQLKKEGSGSKIFNGVTIHVNGYTKPSSDELKRLMMLHGGSYEHYLYRTRVTHVIATNLPDSKVRELKGLKVVRPEWITESIAAGKLLHYSNYLLYTSKSGLQTGLHGLVKRQSSETTISNMGTSLHSVSRLQSNDSNMSSNGTSLLSGSSGSLVDSISENSMMADNTSMNIHPVKRDNKENNQQIPSPKISNQNLSPHETQNGGLINGHSYTASSTSPAKAGDPNFLNEFYSNSRLHYLSTWKAEFKAYVNELQKESGAFSGRERLRKYVQENDTLMEDSGYLGQTGKHKRCVMHIDMDCFFVSVGLRNRPDLKGKPVAVTHSKGKGASIDSESDMFYEAMQWEKKRMTGGKKGNKAPQQHDNNNTDHGFPDKSDSDTDDDVDNTDKSGPTNDSFHSFAEIASCSYEARQRGVKNGMFMGKAMTICPELVTIPYDFEQYKAVSKILYDTVASYSHDIEAVSCDEMLVDCTELLAVTGASPDQFATTLREEIFSKTGCCASAGLASNILLTKMATRKAKPNGQFFLPNDQVDEFIKPQSVKDIPGVGWSLTRRFEAMKVMTCGDLQKVSLDTLQREFGPKTGQSLYKYCRGEDDRPVKIEQQRKSVSAELNYGIRFNSDREAHKFIQELSEEVCSRLQNIQMKGKTITLKLMIRREDAPKATSKFMGHGICNNFSKSVMLPMATDNSKVVGQECLSILKQQKCVASDLRGIGIQIQKLEPSTVGNQGNLSKNQSILNFTVNKNTPKNSSATENSLSTDKIKEHNSNKTVNRATDFQVKGCEDKAFGDKLIDSDKKCDQADCDDSKHNYGQDIETDSVTQSKQKASLVVKRNDILPYEIESDCVAEPKQSSSFVVEKSDTQTSDSKTDCVSDSITGLVVGEISAQSSELLQDLGQRQVLSSQLPPLPCFPELRSPIHSQSSEVDINTPEMGSSRQLRERQETIQDDYFPSPSQIDPDVLKELPKEIRAQVEKEMESRKKATVRRKNSSQGCSHWQSGADNSQQGSQTRGNNSESTKSTRSNVESDIVPLPSSSQLDMSCLNALPESLQDEIRQAYAIQGQTTVGHNTGRSMMNLQQAKSPNKSPKKRSPGKGSPQFKVPKGRPSGRGRKKGSSKKLVFKDQPRIGALVVDKEKSNSRTPHETIIIDNEPLNIPCVDVETPSTSESETVAVINDFEKEEEVVNSDMDVVNLCGAVKIGDVRNMIREWVTSTEVPQTEDEEVILEYIHDLIKDKNLEQVDLVLKAMLRNINRLKNKDWFTTLKRIWSQTQTIVKQYYGHSLTSISL